MQNHSRRAMIAAFVWASATPVFGQALLDSLTQADARRGVRDALGLAAMNATVRLGRQDGFWGDRRVRIPLPGLLAQTQDGLRRLGLSAQLDALQQNLNRAAEAAMPDAGRLFAAAVRGLTLRDAIDIVRGPEDSATRYLRGRTEARLAIALRPLMTRTLNDSGAFALMRSLLREAGLASMAGRIRAEVIEFSTAKALDGCYFFIAEEERAIRRDPVARTTDILRRVFG